MATLEGCGRVGCSPKRLTRDGADHVGVDLFVRCQKCGHEGPYVECVRVTDEQRQIVNRAWAGDAAALRARSKGEG